MVQNYDNLKIGDLLSANYMKDMGEINSRALEVLYKAKYRSDLTPQDVGVRNTGVDDNSQVFEVEAKNG